MVETNIPTKRVAGLDGEGYDALAVLVQLGREWTWVVNIYVNPATSFQRMGYTLADSLGKMTAALQQLQDQHPGPLILVGDFNAHLGQQTGVTRGPHLPQGWIHPPKNVRGVDEMGRLMLEEWDLLGVVPVTGRLKGEAGVPSFVRPTSRGVQQSRPDHIVVDPGMLHNILDCRILQEAWGSDHRPLQLTLGNHTQEGTHPPAVIQKQTPRLVWRPDRQEEYWQEIEIELGRSRPSYDFTTAKELYEHLNQVILAAARKVGMVRPTHNSQRPEKKRCQKHTWTWRQVFNKLAAPHVSYMQAIYKGEVQASPQDLSDRVPDL